MKRKETIPKKDVEFYAFQLNLMLIVLAKAVGWKLDMDWITNVLAPARIEYETARLAWLNPHTRTTEIKDRKKAAEKAYIVLLRILIAILQVLPSVSDAEREDMRIAINKGGGGGHNPKPKDPPPVRLDTSLRCWLIIFFGILGVEIPGRVLRGKPRGVHGAEIIWAILPESPKHHSDLIHSAFSTSSPFRLEFDEADRGKTVYICVRWENTTGEKGPWSDIMSAIIP
jgi:hypothetical protein